MNNNEARAYATLAMEKAGIPAVQIGAVLGQMWDLFDKVNEFEAIDLALPVMSRAVNAFDLLLRQEGIGRIEKVGKDKFQVIKG